MSLVFSIILAGCTLVEEVINDPYVSLVKNGHFNSYPDQTVGEAFDSFFSSPSWTYFEADTGEDVVEFTGGFTYYEQEAEALIQFIVYEDDSFEINAVSYNDIPQNMFNYMLLISAIYENDVDELDFETEEVATVEEQTSAQQEDTQVVTDADLINDVKSSILEEINYHNIGDIFNESLFSNGSWNVDNGVVSFDGHYNGEIFPGEPSHLSFTFYPDTNNFYYSTEIKYNGTEVSEEGHYSIIELLQYALQSDLVLEEEFTIGPWEAIDLVEYVTGFQYADAYDASTGQYETEPESMQIFGTFCWIIPVIDPVSANFYGEFYVDWYTGDIYDEFGEIIY